MRTNKVVFDRVWPGHPFLVKENEYCKVNLAQGTVLKKLVQDDWRPAVMPDGKHTVDCLYRIDCEQYSEPVESTWAISDKVIEG